MLCERSFNLLQQNRAPLSQISCNRFEVLTPFYLFKALQASLIHCFLSALLLLFFDLYQQLSQLKGEGTISECQCYRLNTSPLQTHHQKSYTVSITKITRELHSVKIGANDSFFVTLGITFLKGDLNFFFSPLPPFLKAKLPSTATATVFRCLQTHFIPGLILTTQGFHFVFTIQFSIILLLDYILPRYGLKPLYF